jgi:SAM-dependent methyltransferase
MRDLHMPSSSTDRELLDSNGRFYNALWHDARLVWPECFNTWPLVSSLLQPGQRRLEVAPGLRPRLPLAGTKFVDISAPALSKLQACGADTLLSSISELPFADASFDLICALDVIEHVDDDPRALAELARVAAPVATLLLSIPLHPQWWTPFDDFVGHRRRYEPMEILSLISRCGFVVMQSAVFGMKPKSSRLVNLGMWFLQHRRQQSMWWYNRVLPFTVRYQKKLEPVTGLLDTSDVGEMLLVCQREAR